MQSRVVSCVHVCMLFMSRGNCATTLASIIQSQAVRWSQTTVTQAQGLLQNFDFNMYIPQKMKWGQFKDNLWYKSTKSCPCKTQVISHQMWFAMGLHEARGCGKSLHRPDRVGYNSYIPWIGFLALVKHECSTKKKLYPWSKRRNHSCFMVHPIRRVWKHLLTNIPTARICK